MPKSRDHISLKTLLASAICDILEIPYADAQLMTDDQVISLVHRDHWPIRYADGLALGMTPEELNHHSNIKLRSIMAHREKTAKIDIPAIAKSRRINKEPERWINLSGPKQQPKPRARIRRKIKSANRWPKGRKVRWWAR